MLERIKALKDEKSATDLWLQIYKQRLIHEEWEDAAYKLHTSRYEQIEREIVPHVSS